MNKFLISHDRPLIIAHRGASGDEPENTMASYLAAIKVGADAIELDVRFTRDKQLVIMHDSSVDRTTDGTGRVRQLSLEEIRECHTPDDQPVLTLEEVFQKLRGKTLFYIDIKNYMRPIDWFGRLDRTICQLVDQYDLTDDVMLGSFLPTSGRRVKKALPDACFCWLFFGGIKFISGPWRKYFDVWGLHIGKLAPSSVRRLMRHRLVVNSWVIDDLPAQRKLIKMHVAMINTNKPAQVYRLFH